MTRRKKKLLFVVIPSALIIFAVCAPRFLFRQTRVSHELNEMIRIVDSLEVFSENVRIIDYRGRMFSMYAKLELTINEYNQLKQIFLQTKGTLANKDFEESVYSYDSKYFLSGLSTMNNIKKTHGYQSMNLDDYEELFILDRLYGKWFTTGSTHYILVKENSGNCYLYICA